MQPIDRHPKQTVHGIDPSVSLMQQKEGIDKQKDFVTKQTVYLGRSKDFVAKQTVYPADRTDLDCNGTVEAIEQPKQMRAGQFRVAKGWRSALDSTVGSLKALNGKS